MNNYNDLHVCKICGKECKRLGCHVKAKHHIGVKQYYLDYICNDVSETICPVCGKPTPFIGLELGFAGHCSTECSNKDPETKQKMKDSFIEHFGVDNPNKCDEVVQKRKNTNLERYGCTSSLGAKQSIEKSKQTKLLRYNDANYTNSQKSQQTKLERYGDKNYNNREKAEQTCIERYGVSNALKLESVKEKQQNTNEERYGCKFTIQNQQCNEKRKATCVERYGVENVWSSDNPELNGIATRIEKYGAAYTGQSDELRAKMESTCIERYGAPHPAQNKSIHDKIIATQKSSYSTIDSTRFDSSWEASVYDYCLSNDIEIDDRQIKIDYNVNDVSHVTFIDFRINDNLFEVKGNHLLEGCYDYSGVPIYEKLKVYRDNNITIITSNIEKYMKDQKYDGIKFLDINNLEELKNVK